MSYSNPFFESPLFSYKTGLVNINRFFSEKMIQQVGIIVSTLIINYDISLVAAMDLFED